MPSLGLLIGVTTVVLVAIVASVTLSVTLTYSLDALRTVGKGHTDAVLNLAYQKLFKYINVPTQVVNAGADYFVVGSKPFPSEDQSYKQIYAQADTVLSLWRASPGADQLTLFLRDGSFTPAINHPFAPGYLLQEIMIPWPNGTIRALTRAFHGNLTDAGPEVLRGLATLDVRGYFLPGQLGSVFTDHVLTGPFRDKPMLAPPIFVAWTRPGMPVVPMWQVAAVRSIYNKTGTNLGFAYSTITDTTFGTFLHESKNTPNSQLFILGSDGRFMGSTHPAPIYNATIVPLGTQASNDGCGTTEFTSTLIFGGDNYLGCRTHVSEYGYTPLKSLYARGLPAVGTGAIFVELDGENFFAATALLNATGVVPMSFAFTVVMMMPEADVIGDVVKGRNIAIGVTVAVLVVGTAIASAIVFVLLRPLDRVAARMQDAAELQDEDTSRELSVISEVAALQASYYSLNDELKRISAFVPASVLANRGCDDEIDGLKSEDPNVKESARDDTTSHSSRRSRRTATTRSSADHTLSSALNTAVGLSDRSVTVLVTNCRGFNETIRGLTHSELTNKYATFVDGVAAAISEHQGVLDYFHGDRVMATFNGARQIAAHSRRAVGAALALTQKATTFGPLAIGIEAGKARVGNVGGASAKRYCVFGPTVSRAFTMCTAAANIAATAPVSTGAGVPPGSCVLVSNHVAADVSTHFVTLCVDVLRPAKGTATAVRMVLAAHAEGAKDDEWLYVVGGNDANAGPVAVLNKAATAMAGGDDSNAMTLLAAVQEGGELVQYAKARIMNASQPSLPLPTV